MKNNQLSEKDFQHMINEVYKFNCIAGNSVEDESLLKTYWKLIKEEGKELFTAKTNIDILDAIVDSIFVGFYYDMVDLRYKSVSCTLDPDCENESYVEALEAFKECLYDGFNPIASLVDLCYLSQDTFDIRGAFAEVMRSNMSKYNLKGTIDIDKEVDYISKYSRYSEVYAQEVEYEGGTYIVFRALKDDDNGVTFDHPGKIVKPSTFSEPDLSKFIY